MADNAPNNGRVTNAILGTKLDALHEDVKHLCAQCETRDVRLRAVEQEQAKQSERMGIFGIINAGWSVFVAAIAGYIGSQN